VGVKAGEDVVFAASVSESGMSDKGMEILESCWKGDGVEGVVVKEFDLEMDEGLRKETIESRVGEPLEYLLDLRDLTEDKISNCSCSDMRDGREGRGGRGREGGPVGGGLDGPGGM
jgi:hypothetical protein